MKNTSKNVKFNVVTIGQISEEQIVQAKNRMRVVPKPDKKMALSNKLANKRRSFLNLNDFTCDMCGESFDKRLGLKAHVATHGVKTFKCIACNETFQYKLGLHKHNKIFHPSFKK